MTPHFRSLLDELESADLALELALFKSHHGDGSDLDLSEDDVEAARARRYAAAEAIMDHANDVDEVAAGHLAWRADPMAQREAVAAE